MEPSPYRLNELFARELEDELMKYTSNCERNKVDLSSAEPIEKARRSAEEEVVNIVECSKSTRPGTLETIAVECGDTTESSSSFDDSDCGVDGSGESEALSGFHCDAGSVLDSDVPEELFRKKRLTNHWKSYIQPLAWRCKWVELQIKKLKEQAQRYDRKVEEFRQQKQLQLEKSTWEVHSVKSLPLSQNYGKNKILQRNKRRKDEATEDVAGYMLKHNLFSYYEDKKAFANGAFMNNIPMNPAKTTKKFNIYDECSGFDEKPSCGERGNGDTALEQLYQRITLLQSHVGKLKSRANKVISENSHKFPSNENLIPPTPHNVLAGPPPTTAAHPNNPGGMPVGSCVAPQEPLGYNMNHVSMPESAVIHHAAAIASEHGYFAQGGSVCVNSQNGKEKMYTFAVANAQPIHMPVSQSGNIPPVVPVNVQPIHMPILQGSNIPPFVPANVHPIHMPMLQSSNIPPVGPTNIQPLHMPILQGSDIPPVVPANIQPIPMPVLQSSDNPTIAAPMLPTNKQPPPTIHTISNLPKPRSNSRRRCARKGTAR